jgi:hypothetical protein
MLADAGPERPVQLVLNTDLQPYEHFMPVKLAQVIEGASHYNDDGKMVAVVWECDNRGIANLQAELLWDKGLPARLVADDQEAGSFVKEILKYGL